MNADRDVAILDACVLHPVAIRDLLLNLASAELFEPRWSRQIMAERARSLRRRRHLTDQQIYSAEDAMNEAFPDALVNVDNNTGERIRLPDMNDVHVLIAAITSGASKIVTLNLRDFPTDVMREYGISAEHPDEFCERIIRSSVRMSVEAFELHRCSLSRPPLTTEKALEGLVDCGMVKSAALLNALLKFL